MSYTKITTVVNSGESSDYSDSQDTFYEDEWTSGNVWKLHIDLTADTPHSIVMTAFSSINSVVIRNDHTSDYVAVLVAGADGDCNQRIPFGETLKLSDVSESGDIMLTASTTDAPVTVIIIGD